jgi:hypothetical protein
LVAKPLELTRPLRSLALRFSEKPALAQLAIWLHSITLKQGASFTRFPCDARLRQTGFRGGIPDFFVFAKTTGSRPAPG